jgi:hypothetical protein
MIDSPEIAAPPASSPAPSPASRNFNSMALFGNFHQGPKIAGSPPIHNATGHITENSTRLLDAIRNEATKGPYQIQIFFVRPPNPPQGFFGMYRGKIMVFYELWHRIKEETHWGFRPDHFGKIMAIARTHGCGVPDILFPVVALPKRSKADSYVQAVRQVRLSNGKDWTISESILSFATSFEKTDDDVKSIVYKHLDALADPKTKTVYFEQRKNNSTAKLQAEIDPNNGPMWTTLRSARSDTVLKEMKHLDQIITTDAAVEVTREMFGLNGGPETWENKEIASFASYRF